MKKAVSIIACFVLALTFATSACADNRKTSVYIASGSSSAYRYHQTTSCPSLRLSIVTELSLEEAASSGYTACSRCLPPEPDFEVLATPKPNNSGGWGTTRSAKASARNHDSQLSARDVIETSVKIVLAVFAVGYIGFFLYGVIVVSIAEHKEKRKQKDEVSLQVTPGQKK